MKPRRPRLSQPGGDWRRPRPAAYSIAFATMSVSSSWARPTTSPHALTQSPWNRYMDATGSPFPAARVFIRLQAVRNRERDFDVQGQCEPGGGIRTASVECQGLADRRQNHAGMAVRRLSRRRPAAQDLMAG